MPIDFKRLMAGRFLFTLGVQVQAVVLGWQMYVLTQDPLFLGLIGLAEAVPALGLALYAGYVVDRGRPLLIYRNVVGVSFLSGLVLALSQLYAAHLSHDAQVIALFVSSFLTGTARAFSQPAVFAAVPRLVERNLLPKASAWMASAMQVARISGPALGGILFGWIGVSVSAAFVCVALVGAFAALQLIRTPLPALPPHQHPSIKAEFLAGASFVFRHPILFPAMLLDMVAVLFGGVTALLPIFAAEILLIGPKGLGALRAAPAVGAALMSFWLTSRDFRKNAGTWLFAAVAGFGACILLFALSRNFTVSLVALTLSGAFDSVSMVIRTAAVQLSSPDAMRGKISAVNSIFIGSSNELGELESGVVARFFGVVPTAVFGGIMCLLTVAGCAYFFPKLRRLDFNQLRASSS